MYKKKQVHRDLSTGNILSMNGTARLVELEVTSLSLPARDDFHPCFTGHIRHHGN